MHSQDIHSLGGKQVARDRPLDSNLVLRMEHPDLSADSAGNEDVGLLVAQRQRRPRQRVKIFPEIGSKEY